MVTQLADEQVWSSVQRALECYCICSEAITYRMSANEPLPKQLQDSLVDCVELCQVAASFMLRGSPAQQQINVACRQVCDRVAQGCRAIDDDFIQQCGEASQRCADSIRQLEHEFAVSWQPHDAGRVTKLQPISLTDNAAG